MYYAYSSVSVIYPLEFGRREACLNGKTMGIKKKLRRDLKSLIMLISVFNKERS
jgi:hypothetical protein